jgi:hypothetical protein
VTVHEDLAQVVLDEILRDGPSAHVLAETRQKIRDGRLKGAHLDSIGQTFHRAPNWPMEQLASWLDVHSNLMAGTYADVWIEVGSGPGSDDDRHNNAAALVDLPKPFIAHVDMDQNCSDQDGWLEWTEPIWVWRSTGTPYVDGDGEQKPVYVRHQIPAGTAPLEIGLTMPSRTMLHLLQDRGVARWAYGSNSIDLILSVDRFVRGGF